MIKWIILFLGIAANASASILIKYAMTEPRKFPSLTDPLAAITNWPLWLGLFFYGLAFLLYAAALVRLPLNIAHPILTAGAIATVALASMLIFKEPFYWNTITGLVLILIGVILITYKIS